MKRKKLSQRFTNNPHVGTFGSYKQRDEDFTLLPSPTSKSLCERKSLLPMEAAKENPYLGYIRHAPAIDKDAKTSSSQNSESSTSTAQFSCDGSCSCHDHSTEKKKAESQPGLFELLQETPAHAAVTRIGMLGEVWRKRHLSQRLLKELPLISFTSVRPTGILGMLMCKGLHHGQTTCAICKCEFEEGESLRLLPCGHVFHKRCADTWLLGSDGYPFIQTDTCPLCKINVAEEINKKCTKGITRSQYAAVGAYVWNNCSSRAKRTIQSKCLLPVPNTPCTLWTQHRQQCFTILVNLLQYHRKSSHLATCQSVLNCF